MHACHSQYNASHHNILYKCCGRPLNARLLIQCNPRGRGNCTSKRACTSKHFKQTVNSVPWNTENLYKQSRTALGLWAPLATAVKTCAALLRGLNGTLPRNETFWAVSTWSFYSFPIILFACTSSGQSYNIDSSVASIFWHHWHSDWLETRLHFEVFWTFIEKCFFDRSRLPVWLSLPYQCLVKIWRANLPSNLIQTEVKLRFFDSSTGCSSMFTLFVTRVLRTFDPSEPLNYSFRWSVADRTKTSTEVDQVHMWRWNDSWNSLRAGDFGRPRPLFVSALPRVYCRASSRLLNGTTIEQAACVTLSTKLDGNAENGLLLRFRLQHVRQAPKRWHKLSLVSEERGISTTFVGWLLCDFIRCPKTGKTCRKNKQWMKDTSTGQRSASSENQGYPLIFWGWDDQRVLVQKSSQRRQEHMTQWRNVCKQWHVDSDSWRSTCSASTLSELSQRTRHNENNRCSPVFDPSRWTPDLHTATRTCSHRSRRPQVQVWPGSLSFSPDWAAARSGSTIVMYSASCRSFYGVASSLCEAKNWDQNRRQTRMKKCYSFQMPSLEA